MGNVVKEIRRFVGFFCFMRMSLYRILIYFYVGEVKVERNRVNCFRINEMVVINKINYTGLFVCF